MTVSVIGALRVNLSADTAEFKRGMTDAEKMAKRFGDKVGGQIRQQLMTFGAAAAAAAGPAALGLLVKSSIETISAQVDLANRVGASVTAIQTLAYAAKLSGASQEALAKTLGTLNVRLGEAARTGAGPAYEALERLGLSARELASMDADERIKALSDRMAELGYTTQQQADTLKSLGVRQQEIINLFQEGSAAINQAQQELRDWGVLLSDVDASKVEAAGDALDKMWTMLQGVGNQIAVETAPALERMSTALGSVAEQGKLAKFVGQQIAEVFDDISEAIVRDTANFKVAMRYYQEADEILGAIMGGREGDSFFHVPDFTAAVEAHKQATVDIEKIWTEMDQRLNQLKGPHPLLESVDAYIAKMQAARRETGDDGDGETDADKRAREKAAEELERYQAQLTQRLTALQESLMTEREAEIASYEQRLMDMEDFHARGLISDEEYKALLAKNQIAHAAQMKAIDDEVARNNERNAERQRRAIYGIVDDIGSALNSIFGDSKVVSIAQAVINTAQAVTKSLAEYGATPIGFAAAAAAAAAGAAEIATIASTSPGSGRGGGRSRASTSAPAASPTPQSSGQAGTQQSFYISLQGSTFGAEQVRQLIAQINEQVADGVKLIVDPAV